ncbi:MAG: nucleotidyltransferase domain-containing protein [Verrucomicrobiota bacterium]
MKNLIRDRLTEIERAHSVRVLYACESGSRAWGFESADSDYDVRFIFVHERDGYLSLDEPKASFDYPIDSDLIDLSGWELRKSLQLFGQSNATLLEWLHSPLAYYEDASALKLWRHLATEAFSPKAVAGHYYGLCRKIWTGMVETGHYTAKKYLYAMRAACAKAFVTQGGGLVPVRFSELLERVPLSDEVVATVNRMVEEKFSGSESDVISSNVCLDRYIVGQMESWENDVRLLPSVKVESGKLDQFFRKQLYERIHPS